MSVNTSPTPTQPGRWIVSAFGPPSVLQWHPFPDNKPPKVTPFTPTPTATLRILITGISGADNIMRAGGYTRIPQTQHPGFTPGYDLVGVIEAINASPVSNSSSPSSTTTLKVGEIVASISIVGAYATHIDLPLTDLLPLRPSDDLIAMAALPLNYMTAYGMLAHSVFPLTSSTNSILIGSVAGGVGTAVAQVAKMLFPNLRTFGTCSPSKFEFVRGLGVTPIDRRIPAEEIAEEVRRLNGGEGVDVAYEATGSVENMRGFLAATRMGTGTLIATGFMANVSADGAGMEVEQFDPVSFTQLPENVERMSFFGVTSQYWKGKREVFKRDFEEVLVRAVREGRLEPKVGSLWRLEDAVRVNEMLASGKGVTGKLEMIVDQELWEKHGRSML